MNSNLVEKIWYDYLPHETHRRFTFAAREKITSLDLLEWQYRYLIRAYMKIAPYPNISDFLEWVDGMLRAEDVPEELSCRGLLSDNPTLVNAATQLETIAGAWFPNEMTEKKIAYLREVLNGAFS